MLPFFDDWNLFPRRCRVCNLAMWAGHQRLPSTGANYKFAPARGKRTKTNSDMNAGNRDGRLRRLDLNLLWVFHAVMRHRKLTIAAEHLAVTQSAVSHALRRLRHTFKDELFLRTGHGLEPTAIRQA